MHDRPSQQMNELDERILSKDEIDWQEGGNTDDISMWNFL